MLRPLANGGYKLQPYDVERRRASERREKNPPLEIPAFSNERLRAIAVPVGHGSVPALAWRIEAGGKRIVFSGDTNGVGAGLTALARDADIFIAHHAVPEDSGDAVALRLHMPPSAIGRIARDARVKQVVLSHRMLRTLGREQETLEAIRKSYAGPVSFADDLHCYLP